MKDYLQDLIQHTNGLGAIDLVKVVGTDKQTQIFAMSDEKTVLVTGTFNNPIADFIGVFGMPNLTKLKTILGFDDVYDENAKITIISNNKEDSTVPTNIHFETKSGDFVNDYRLMSRALIEEKVKTFNFKGATWNVEFVPSVASIQRLKKQAQANSEEDNFITKTDKGDLKIYFGDPSTHSGNFVFHAGVNGTLNRGWNWPIKEFLAIMDLPGDKTIKISDQGATEITVDSGLAKYVYIMPAKTK